jgi:hypothetical protein
MPADLAANSGGVAGTLPRPNHFLPFALRRGHPPDGQRPRAGGGQAASPRGAWPAGACGTVARWQGDPRPRRKSRTQNSFRRRVTWPRPRAVGKVTKGQSRPRPGGDRQVSGQPPPFPDSLSLPLALPEASCLGSLPYPNRPRCANWECESSAKPGGGKSGLSSGAIALWLDRPTRRPDNELAIFTPLRTYRDRGGHGPPVAHRCSPGSDPGAPAPGVSGVDGWTGRRRRQWSVSSTQRGTAAAPGVRPRRAEWQLDRRFPDRRGALSGRPLERGER